jgi:hypothetical protein
MASSTSGTDGQLNRPLSRLCPFETGRNNLLPYRRMSMPDFASAQIGIGLWKLRSVERVVVCVDGR